MINDFKQIKILGYTTDFNKCDCCGKENLKGTVTILHIDSETIAHYGTTCAAAAEKYDTLDAAKQAKKDVNKVVNEFKALQQFGWLVAWKLLRKKYGKTANNTNVPKEEWEALTTDCERFYTNPANKGKAYNNQNYQYN